MDEIRWTDKVYLDSHDNIRSIFDDRILLPYRVTYDYSTHTTASSYGGDVDINYSDIKKSEDQ